MFSSRSRNYSLKSLYTAKNERKQVQEPVQKAKGFGLLPTIAENRQTQRIQAKQLGININKFQHLAHRDPSEVNTEDVVRNIYFIIKNFGEVQSNFKSLFSNLHLKIKDFLFLHDLDICQKYKIREACSNKKAIKFMDKFHQNVVKAKDKEIVNLETEFAQKQQMYRLRVEQRQLEVFTLKQEVQKYKKMANVEYVRSLQKKVQGLKALVSNQEDQYRILAKKNEEISLELQSVRKELQQQEQKCVRYESLVYDLNLHKERTELYLLKFKDRFDELAGRLQSFKNIIQKVEAQNENLVSQRMKLVNRAAVTFEDLTPRPQYSNHFKFDEKINLISTSQIMQKIIGEIPQKQQFFEKNCVAKKNRKLMECEAIREKTVQQILKAKNQLTQLLI